jgi:hypothetical protein
MILESSLSCFSSLCHLICITVSSDRNNHFSLRDRHVTKLFDCHFYANRDSIFIYNLHVSGSTVMHTFDVVLVLLSEQHTILIAHINLLVVHAETDQNLLKWYKSFDMLYFNGMVQVFQEVVL